MTGKLMKRVSILSATILCASAATSADALVINNYFSYNLRANPRAAEIMAAINYSSNAFAALLSNDVTVNIQYDLDLNSTGWLGMSGSAGGLYSKEYYASMLASNAAAHPENTVLAQAVNSLGQGNYSDPDLLYVSATSAQLRANGIDVPGYFEQFVNDDETPVYDLGGETLKGGGLDGVLSIASIDSMIFGFDIPEWDGTDATAFYPAINTIQHEIMHILGGGNSNAGSPDTMQPLDMYRYSGPGVPNFTPYSEAGRAYFSIDGGVTEIQQFNDNSWGDINGWGPRLPCPSGGGSGGPIGLFMDANSCANQPVVTFNLASPEGIEMMALGWNPRVAAVPEPASWALMLLGFGGVGMALRRRRVVFDTASARA